MGSRSQKWLTEYEQTTHEETDIEPLASVPSIEHTVCLPVTWPSLSLAR
jgi:hypothetical protein